MSAKWGTKLIPVTLVKGLLCCHSGHAGVAGRTRDCCSHLDTEPSPELKAAPAAGPSLGGKQAESCSSFSSQDQSSEGLITSSAADTPIPARLHRQLQLPQAAHPPQSPAGPEKQNLSRKLGQRWVLPHYRPIPTEFLFSLHFPYLQQGREQLCRCLQKWRKRAKQTFWFFDIRLWFRFSDELSQVTDSSKRHPPEERSEEPHGWSKELGHYGRCIWLYIGYILESKRNNN